MDSSVVFENIFIFSFGLVIGSFLNVVILRYNTGRGFKGLCGRSACFSCGKTLRWHHLIPLISFFAQNGRCAFCTSRISWQYPAVELVTALFFVLVFYEFRTPSYYLPLYLIVVCCSVIIFVYDIKHKIIPDGVVYGFITTALILFTSRGLVFNDFISALLIFLFFFSLWYFSHGTWMGLGDGKLALAIGLFLPWPLNLTAIIISFWIGAAYGLIMIGYEKLFLNHNKISMKSELPFAPFMLISFFFVLFTNIDILSMFNV